MSDDLLRFLGPLAALVGTWEGEKGLDKAPDDDRTGVETNRYRERFTFEPFGPTNNHEQELYGLRYARTAWRIGEDQPFHEDMGYVSWDAAEQQVMRTFVVPRGIAIQAGGTVAPEATAFTLAAELGSPVYGICSNPFLDREFKTVQYAWTVTVHGGDSFSYEEVTQIQMKGRTDLFQHLDANALKRVSG